MTKIQNLKRVFELLEFGYCLLFGAWDFLNPWTKLPFDS